MFSTFEHSVDFFYRNVLRRTKEDCSKAQQLGVTCIAGYAAGSFGSFISNPADNIVAYLYNKKADSLMLVGNPSYIYVVDYFIMHNQHSYWFNLAPFDE